MQQLSTKAQTVSPTRLWATMEWQKIKRLRALRKARRGIAMSMMKSRTMMRKSHLPRKKNKQRSLLPNSKTRKKQLATLLRLRRMSKKPNSKTLLMQNQRSKVVQSNPNEVLGQLRSRQHRLKHLSLQLAY